MIAKKKNVETIAIESAQTSYRLDDSYMFQRLYVARRHGKLEGRWLMQPILNGPARMELIHQMLSPLPDNGSGVRRGNFVTEGLQLRPSGTIVA